MDRTFQSTDNYLEKILKILPGEITAVYLAIRSVVQMVSGSSGSTLGPYILFYLSIVLALATPFLMPVFGIEARKAQRYFIGASFFIWALNIEYENISLLAPPDLGVPLQYAIPILLIIWAGLGIPTFIHYFGNIEK